MEPEKSELTFTHVGIVTGLNGVVTLKLPSRSIDFALGASLIVQPVVIRHFHGLSLGPALYMLRF